MRYSHSVAVGSPAARFAAIMLALLLVTVAVAGAGFAGNWIFAANAAIVVAQDGSGDFTTLAAAVEDATDGDTILVRAGVYDEQVVVTNDITISGDGDRADVVLEVSDEILPSTTMRSREPAAFLLEDSDATIEGLTLRGDASRIVIVGGAPVLRDLHLDDTGLVYGVDPGAAGMVPDGVHITDGSTATIADSVFDRVGMTMFDSAPTIVRNKVLVGPIWVAGSGVEPHIEGNTFESEGPWAITVAQGAQPTIVGNTIHGDALGVSVQGVANPTLLRNTVEGAEVGLSLASPSGAHVQDNEFLDNQVAISIATSNVTIVGNTVRGGDTGILTLGSSSPQLEGNVISDAGQRGVSILGLSSPVLVGNRICGNAANLWIDETAEPVIDATNVICEDA